MPTDVVLDLQEARECPAFHETLSSLRRGKSKKRSTKEGDLKWFYRLSFSIGPTRLASGTSLEKTNKRLEHAIVYLCCRAPGKGQRTNMSSRLNYTPPQIRSYIKALEIYRT